MAVASLQAGRVTGARVLTPPSYYVESLAFSPDGRDIACAASPGSGFMSQS
jgi:WD40 repeat protein